MRHALPALVLAAVATSAAHGQVRRYPADAFDDILVLRDIISAFLDGVDVDDPDVLARTYPGRSFADFDRNRNGQFLTAEDGFGINDVDLAILQFVHGDIDADRDGVLGFVEIECAFAGGPTLDPDRPSTVDGIPDAEQDCDGDGVSNAAEAQVRINPLDPASVCVPEPETCDRIDNDCDGEIDEVPPGEPGACDRRGEFFLDELVRIDPDFGFAITLTEVVGWVRSYEIPPGERPLLASEGGCTLYDANAAADPGVFESIDAGPVSVRGGVEEFTMTFDELSRNYEADEVPFDLWMPGQELELSAPGDDLGAFAVTIPAPADIELQAPDAENGLSRANPVVQWTPGDADAPPVLFRLTFGDADMAWELVCALPDVGEATLPEVVMDWIPPGTDEVGVLITRRVTRAVDAAPPEGTVTVQLDARYGGFRVPILP